MAEKTELRDKVRPFVLSLTNKVSDQRWGVTPETLVNISRGAFDLYKDILSEGDRDLLGAVIMLFFIPDDYKIDYIDVRNDVSIEVGRILETAKTITTDTIKGDYDQNFIFLISEIIQGNIIKMTDPTLYGTKQAAYPALRAIHSRSDQQVLISTLDVIYLYSESSVSVSSSGSSVSTP